MSFAAVAASRVNTQSYSAGEEDNDTGNWFILDATQLEVTQQITAMMIKAQGKILASLFSVCPDTTTAWKGWTCRWMEDGETDRQTDRQTDRPTYDAQWATPSGCSVTAKDHLLNYSMLIKLDSYVHMQ